MAWVSERIGLTMPRVATIRLIAAPMTMKMTAEIAEIRMAVVEEATAASRASASDLPE
ncbi:hypothetical protein D3C73_461730 [compost metagenome]